jgi:hypothetical protein
MTFLNPTWLFALPLVLIPILIHLLNQRRHRTVDWGAMQFLLSAKRMSKGMARLKQWMIMAMRMLVIAGLIFVITRPLSSGWVGSLTGGKPETVVIVLDRSASMQQQRLQTGQTKLSLGKQKISEALMTLGGTPSIVLVDGFSPKPIELSKPDDLLDLPAADPTEAESDLATMLDTTLDYINDNQTGRTDVWICSDSGVNDWRPESTRWKAINSGFSKLEGVRFHLLNFAQPVESNLALNVTRNDRVDSTGSSELVIDFTVERTGESSIAGDDSIPVSFNISGLRSTLEVKIEGEMASVNGHRIPIDPELKLGWGKVELPLDASPSDNDWHFAFAQALPRKTIVVSDSAKTHRAISLAASTSLDANSAYESKVVTLDRVGEIDWQETAVIVWQADLPDELTAKQIKRFAEMGRTVVFMPPDNPNDNSFAGVRWKQWSSFNAEGEPISYWNNRSGLLAKTRNGDALPVDELRVYRHCGAEGELSVLAKLKDETPILSRANSDAGTIYFLGTWPSATHSNLGREGVTLFAMVHRMIAAAAESLGAAKQFEAGTIPARQANQLPSLTIDGDNESVQLAESNSLRSGIYGNDKQLIALNRSESEDRNETMTRPELDGIFAGLDYHVVDEQLTNNASLASEIWKLFIVLAGLALLAEAVLCLPPKPEADAAAVTVGSASRRRAAA